MTSSAPPFEQQFRDGMAFVRDALSHAPEATREEVKQVLDSKELVERVVNIVVPLMDRRFRLKYYRNMILGVGVLLVIFGGAFLFAFQKINAVATENAIQDIALARTQATIDSFEQQLQAANAKLVAQGLPPVPAPSDVQPDTPEQAQLINAAATASTLASLPPTAFRDPDPAVIASAVANYLKVNPPVIDPDLVIKAVADYFEANPDAFRGPAGPPPTAEEIQAAFRDEIARNPQILCPLGGTYGQRSVELSGGGSTTQFGCFGEDVPPLDTGGGGTVEPTPTPTPEPTSEPSSEPTPTTTPEPTQGSGEVLGDLLGTG